MATKANFWAIAALLAIMASITLGLIAQANTIALPSYPVNTDVQLLVNIDDQPEADLHITTDDGLISLEGLSAPQVSYTRRIAIIDLTGTGSDWASSISLIKGSAGLGVSLWGNPDGNTYSTRIEGNDNNLYLENLEAGLLNDRVKALVIEFPDIGETFNGNEWVDLYLYNNVQDGDLSALHIITDGYSIYTAVGDQQLEVPITWRRIAMVNLAGTLWTDSVSAITGNAGRGLTLWGIPNDRAIGIRASGTDLPNIAGSILHDRAKWATIELPDYTDSTSWDLSIDAPSEITLGDEVTITASWTAPLRTPMPMSLRAQIYVNDQMVSEHLIAEMQADLNTAHLPLSEGDNTVALKIVDGASMVAQTIANISAAAPVGMTNTLYIPDIQR